MPRYQCDICHEYEVDSKSVPETCSGCGANYSPWINLDSKELEFAEKKYSASTFVTKKLPVVKKKKASPKPIIPPYVPPPPPPSPTPLPPITPSLTSDIAIFLDELKYASNQIFQYIKDKKKLIFISSIILFILSILFWKPGLVFYIFLLVLSLALLILYIYIKSVKSFTISSLYKYYKPLAVYFGCITLLIPLSFLQGVISTSYLISNNGKDLKNIVQDNYTTEVSNSESSAESTPDAENQNSVQRNNQNLIAFYPFENQRDFGIKKEDSNLLKDIIKDLKRLFTGTSLDLNDSYYASTKINFRSEPSKSSRVFFTIYPGEIIQFLDEKTGDWLKCQVSDIRGWLYNDESYFTSVMPSVRSVVSTSSLNVRSGPGTSYSIVSRVKSGEAYKFIEFNPQRNWCLVEDRNGNRGWVFFKLIDM